MLRAGSPECDSIANADESWPVLILSLSFGKIQIEGQNFIKRRMGDIEISPGPGEAPSVGLEL